VQLLAVSKTFGPEAVLEAAARASARLAKLSAGRLDKIRALHDAGAPALEWHFIGPIQSNKTRPIAEHFAWVHTVDREDRPAAVEQRPAGMAPLQICLQVNISGEASKSGVAPEEVAALAHKVAALPNLTLRGLMAIPEPAVEFAQQRAAFARCVLCTSSCGPTGWRSIRCRWACRPTCGGHRRRRHHRARRQRHFRRTKLQQGLRHENSIYRRRQYGHRLIAGLANKLTDGANIHVVDPNAEALARCSSSSA
jgi:uncharacterized pyridoxal phosphate-containing UPF0001 family protein